MSTVATTQIKILDERANVPTRAHQSDTGYDLKFIDFDKIVGDVIFFKTGISVMPPAGYYFEVVPRSSISKLPLEMANSVGIIDEHYRGEILVPIRITHNLMGQEETNTSFPQGIVKIFGFRPATMQSVAKLVLTHKPQLCQMILRKREDTVFEVVDTLSETARGDGGFGSTDDSPKTKQPKKIERVSAEHTSTEK